MTSKFTPIVKLKKEELDKAQRELSKINFNIHETEQKRLEYKQRLNSIEKPQSGTMTLFRQYDLECQSMQALIAKEEAKLHKLMSEKNRLQHEVNLAFTSYEKFSYLHAQEEKAYREKQKRLEALQLDEVAQMTYNLNKEG